MAAVAKRRWRPVLMFAIGIIALMALLSVHVHEVAKLPADASSYKLPSKHDIGYQKHNRERSWIQEFAPPHLKNPLPAQKLDNARQSLDSDKLWKRPPNSECVPCTEPTSSRGYLLVHANGGLNQMRAGAEYMAMTEAIIKKQCGYNALSETWE